ncbi:MAG TPA: hypothetical protein VFX96_08235 [Pyrinomonadaceae bacterium]|nr:hypothetical protein [Pyrinomonadaceae bacterium]
MSFSYGQVAAVLVSLALALALTPVVRALAFKFGIVARPRTDRWHRRTTAMLGGAAIFLTTIIGYLLFVPHTPQGWVVVAASSFLFAVGLVDDLLHIKPYQKLVGQLMAAAFVIYYGLQLPWSSYPPLNMAVTLFWLVGITNAINLLDNMDGAAAGVASIAAFFIALNLVGNGQTTEALMLGVFAAALLGFLAYNSNPATIFMGDCGSLFVGFFLAATALLSAAGGRGRSFLIVVAVPVLILFIPIFDTTLVTVVRKLSGRAASQGGRDHMSHRLVALGLSERRAVWMLYGFAGASGLVALLVRNLRAEVSLAVIIGFAVLLALVGVYLAGVKVYDESEVAAARSKPLVSFLVDLSYKRRIFEVLLDVVLIVLAYYTAYLLLFGEMNAEAWVLFLRAAPVLVAIKLAAFLGAGVYRGLWRYISIDNVLVYAKAVAAGTVASVLVLLFAFRFEGFSRGVFVLDALLLFMMLTGSRTAFRLFRRLIPAPNGGEGRRVLIYGAGDAGELLLREMINNKELRYTPVGFLDDDPHKKGRVIHGFRVLGGNGSLRVICREQRVTEVLISSTKVSEDRIREIRTDCEADGVILKRMRIHFEQISDE